VSETEPLRGILRSIGAVLVGVVAVIVLSLGTDVVLHATGFIHLHRDHRESVLPCAWIGGVIRLRARAEA